MKIFFKLVSILIIITSVNACKESSTPTIVEKGVNASIDPLLLKLKEAIKEDPKSAKLYGKRADYYIDHRAFDEAIEDLKINIHLDSLNPNVYHKLADVYVDYFQSRKALRTMRDVLEIYPDRIPSLLKYIELLYILKQYDLALINIDKIAKLDGQNADAAFLLGMVLIEQGEKKKATSAFKKATTFDSQLTDAWMMLGQIYELEENPLAETYYRNAMKTDTNNVRAMHALAFYLQNNNDIPQALNLYKDIVIKDKSYTAGYLNAGVLYIEEKKYDIAMDNFKILIGMDPKSFIAYYFLGVCYEEKGNVKLAKDNYQNCLNFNPKYVNASTALKRLNK